MAAAVDVGPSIAEQLAQVPPGAIKLELSKWSDQEIAELHYCWPVWARPAQRPPPGDWLLWLILAGRGWGKSRTGAETVREWVEDGKCQRLALVGRTAADVRDVMIEGESGLLACSPPWFRPEWEPSKRRVTWPNGAIATTYSADEPDTLRGPQHDGAWIDEPAAWKYPEEAYDNLMFGLRLGKDPRAVATTTPKPTKFVRGLIEDETTRVTKGKTKENVKNLAPTFLRTVVKKYQGTRLGRQELDAELLDDTPGALWTRARIEILRISLKKLPPLRRIVVSIDPSTTGEEGSDEAGILAGGLGYDGHGYLLEDVSGVLTPERWARRGVVLYNNYDADRLVAEVNNGGDMVRLTVRTIDPAVSFKKLWASRGKVARAEPIAALGEQAMIHHVGCFPELEDELCTTNFREIVRSPNRLDAYVWLFTELMLQPKAGRGGKSGGAREMAGGTGGF